MHAIDYGLLLLLLAALAAMGAYFAPQQRTADDYFLGRRRLGWLVCGASLTATLAPAVCYFGLIGWASLPGDAYYAGLHWLLLPVAAWAGLAVVGLLVAPLVRQVEAASLYEYLEYRFGGGVRMAAGGVMTAWRLLWTAAVLYAPCHLLVVGGGWGVPQWLLVLLLGAAAVAWTVLGGLKAVAWTDLVLLCVMLLGTALATLVIMTSVTGGHETIWSTAQQLQRTEVARLELSWNDPWCFWTVLPYFAVATLVFVGGDQAAMQRLLAARDAKAARRGVWLFALLLPLLAGLLAYQGLAMLAWYQQHPEAMRPVWVANLNGERQSLTYADRDRLLASRDAPPLPPGKRPQSPLVGWNEDLTNLDLLEEAVLEGRVLHPNSKEPFASLEELVDPATQQLEVERLAMRRPSGEIVLHRRATDELLPHLILEGLPLGVTGLAVAALLAAGISSMTSGLLAAAGLVLVDLDRHHKLQAWLTGLFPLRSAADAGQQAQVAAGRAATALLGAAATVLAMLMTLLGSLAALVELLVVLGGALAAPVAAVILLGMLTRRTTHAGALAGMAVGMLAGGGLALAVALAPPDAGLSPPLPPLGRNWPLPLSFAATALVGYAASLLVGRAKSKEELRGLVLGVGKLGVRQRERADRPILGPPPPNRKDRWR